MFELLVWITAALCAGGFLYFYMKYKDPFHPAVIMLPMFAFIYVIMPLFQAGDGQLFVFVPVAQLVWVQSIVVAGLVCLIWGFQRGSESQIGVPKRRVVGYRSEVLHKGAYVLGGLGLAAWAYAVHNAGGLTGVFGRPKGMGWSDISYIREAAYLLIVGLLLLISPEGFRPRSKLWLAAVAAFAMPYLLQGLLGAQRGPTFLITVTLAMSWYMARAKRPSLATLVTGGCTLGALMLFLVINRSAIYIGSEKELKSDPSEILNASEENEYVLLPAV